MQSLVEYIYNVDYHLYHILEDYKLKSLNEGSSKIFLRDLKIKLYKR